MKKRREYRDFEQELKKQEKAFEKPSKKGTPNRFEGTAKVMGWVWLVVAAFLLAFTVLFVVYEFIYREGMWMVVLLFAGATLISAASGWGYLRKDRAEQAEDAGE